MNVSVSCRLGVVVILAVSLIGCGSDSVSTADSTNLFPASTTAAPPLSTDAAVATTPPTTASAAATTTPPTTAATTSTPPTTAVATTTSTPSAGSSATCDEASIAKGIGDDVASIVDFQCDQGWAAAYYTDAAGLSRPAILEGEGTRWVLQDWMTVCDGDPMVPGDIEVPESLRVYCPGG
ncbi:MAG: hypothetical protein WD023_01435 [Ilumatobacteraceae bacterium]